MADIYLILVYCSIYIGISLIHCDAITLSGIPTVNYGTRQRLTCRQGGWWGISDTTFYRNGTRVAEIGGGYWKCKLTSDPYDSDFGRKCTWTDRTLIINNIDDGYNSTVWQCESRGEQSNEYTIKVEDISPCKFNVSISGNVSNIVEGENLHLTCNSDDGDHKYFWKIFNNNGSTSTIKQAKNIKQRASRGDSGMYICRVEGKDCTSEAQLDINVQYHPNVTIHSESSNSTINMTCLGDGYPHNFTFYGWHHYINGQLVRILEGKETFGSSVLILEGVTALDNGKYECLLSNGINDTDGNLNSSAEHTVYLPVAPTSIETEIEKMVINKEDDVNLKSVFLVEDVTSVTLIEPSKTHTKLNISDVIKEEFQNIQVYGTTVNVTVSVVQYSIPNVTNEGHYYFNVCNVYQLCNVSYGYKITFKSEESLPGKHDAHEQDQNLPIIIGAVAGVVVLLVIVIICVVRRRASTSESISKDDQPKNSHPNPTYDDGNIEIIPNELYQSSDAQDNNTKMQIIPNELYVSSGPVQNSDLKNMEIIPNELYVSADADNQSGAQAATGPNTGSPDELYVGGETIAKNKEIQKQMKSSQQDDDQVYVNDPVRQ